MAAQGRYQVIIEEIFFQHYGEGVTEFEFNREEIEEAAERLDISLPKNIGDVIYSFRYRTELPDSIVQTSTGERAWAIHPAGIGRYRFVLELSNNIVPSENLINIKILDATPGIIDRYALDDEQGILAKVRYNRLVDVFTGLTCYSLQNHLRTTVPELGQVETDEIYIGVDKRGAHYVIPVQAKGGRDKIGIVQVRQDFAMSETKFPGLICKPVAAKFMSDDVIALFEFELENDEVAVATERHYRLVGTGELSKEELENYRFRTI